MRRHVLAVMFGLLILGTNAGSAPVGEADWKTLEKQFTEMPMEARRFVQPLFWLHGDESADRLQGYLGKVAEGHNGGFCAESRPHSDWLGTKWYEDLGVCLDAAKKLDLKMWIFDERWWPSQTVAGKVPDRYAAKKLMVSTEILQGPASVRREGYTWANFVASIAGRRTETGIDPDSLVDLMQYTKDGVLSWKMPAGTWELMKFEWALAPKARQGSQTTVDGASRDCVEWFLNTVYQPHYDRFKDDFGKTIVGYFYDEPETQGDWGTELPRVMAERGVDWKKALVAWKSTLAGEAQAAAKYAYVDALAEAWGRTMYGMTLDWCERRGVQFIGHFIEHGGWYIKPGHGAMDLFRMQKYNSMGGMDLVCQQLWPGQRTRDIYQLPKLTSSISHAYHKADDLAMTEIFGAYGQGITYPQMKWLLDWHQAGGVNFMVPHSFNPRAPNDTDCPPYFYNGGHEPRWPLYRVWADYSNRLSLLLTGGRHVCPIAFLFCGSSAYVGKAVTPEDMTTVIQDALYDCDWLPYEVFNADAQIAGQEIRLHDERYRVLVVPPVEVIPYETLARAKQFLDAGGIVVGYQFLPTLSATLGHSSEEIKALVESIWGGGEPGLEARRILPNGGRSYFLPADVTAEQLTRVLTDAGVPPELEVLQGQTDGWLHVLHRVKSGRDVYFVCNQQHEGEPKTFRLRARANGFPERWDAMRNDITALPCEAAGDGAVELTLTLEPSESALIVFQLEPSQRRRLPAGPPAQVIAVVREGAAGEIDTDLGVPGLDSCHWVWHGDGDCKDAAPPGTRWFRKTITIPADAKIRSGRFLISADNEFSLYVNGKFAGESSGDHAWRKPKDLQISKFLKPGRNVLAIAATNATYEPNPAGLIGRYAIGFERGEPVIGVIDETWKCTYREEKGWNTLSFDDSRWEQATVVAKYGDLPWGSLDGFLRPADPFLGTCAVPALDDSRVYLEMDDLHEGASVKVNGEFAGGVIGRPFRLDVTSQLKPGENKIEIEPYAPSNARLAVYN